MKRIFATKDVALCYTLISKYYGNTRAKRSGVRYMNHIDEGLAVLYELKASTIACAAYCLHPILQDDVTLVDNLPKVKDVPYDILATTMEYRNVANRGLNCYQVDDPSKIYLGPMKDVHHMLIADKVQNRKDFLIYHAKTHPGAIELDRYFRNWLRALHVSESQYEKFVQAIADTEASFGRPLVAQDTRQNAPIHLVTVDNTCIPYPEHWPKYFNGSGSTPCDSLQGPCSCGAWHNLSEWAVAPGLG